VLSVKDILIKYGVVFVEHHPSISSRCFGVDCPFCGDKNKHLGIFKDHGNYTCWKCGAKGSLFKYLAVTKGVSWQEFQLLHSGIREGNVKNELDKIFNKKPIEKAETETPLPKLTPFNKAPKTLQNSAINFIKNRGFHTNLLLKYQCCFCFEKRYVGRLIIPIFAREKLVSFTGRSLSDKIIPKYIFPRGARVHEHVYLTSTDFVPVICEGIFDAWALQEVGVSAVAIFGKILTDKQLLRLTQIFPPSHEIAIMLDGDAKAEAETLRGKLEPFFGHVKMCFLPDDEDPASMFEKKQLKKMVKKCGIL